MRKHSHVQNLPVRNTGQVISNIKKKPFAVVSKLCLPIKLQEILRTINMLRNPNIFIVSVLVQSQVPGIDIIL